MPVHNREYFIINSAAQLILIIVSRILLGIYNNVWRYTSTAAYLELVIADSVAGLVSLFLNRLVGAYYGIWQALIVGACTLLVALTSRFTYALLYKHTNQANDGTPKSPIAIVGAGRLGTYLAGDLQSNPHSTFDPLFFIDIDNTKIGNRISGLKVYDKENATELIKKLEIKHIAITISSTKDDSLSDIYHYYNRLGCNILILDSIMGAGHQKRTLREFSVEDLLFREPIDVSKDNTYYTNKTVLVTGGGGSIGSELCRQIASCSPTKLVIFDIYENNAYDIQQELKNNYPTLPLSVEIGSVRDKARVDNLFKTHRPQVVFHAAAHKHVPLMEHSNAEAIKNNVFGTYNVANAAEKYGAEKFILISTDKAVNPTNIMGASKRLCEMVVLCRTDSKTSFSAVRFGNVLGSNGWVIPLFKNQIKKGGPVTITDKRIIGYFMTIPEASGLVMLAGNLAQKGELFVLDMGKPVKIYDLAYDMIKLSGYEPEKDIKIVEIGLRPGEKLYEELLIKSEHLEKTENDLIFIEKDKPFTREEVEQKLSELKSAVKLADGGDCSCIKAAVKNAVPTYKDPEEVNCDAENSDEMKKARKTKEK
ncbi:MAG: polysaccharide biosynthesis protein [Oscillospiraceae bacterium]|nr:polysaccharide biosynthesis protein [Candidatus Equicaccousia limihippi]